MHPHLSNHTGASALKRGSKSAAGGRGAGVPRVSDRRGAAGPGSSQRGCTLHRRLPVMTGAGSQRSAVRSRSICRRATFLQPGPWRQISTCCTWRECQVGPVLRPAAP